MEATPLRGNDGGAVRPIVEDAAAEIANSRSQDRLEIYLTPKGRLRYTLIRLQRFLPSIGIDKRRTGIHPYVRLYAPPPTPAARQGPAGHVDDLCSAGPYDLLLDQGRASCTLSLGMKVRDLTPGRYVASILTLEGTASKIVAQEETAFEVDCLDVEWVLPPLPVSLIPGNRYRVALSRIDGAVRKQVYASHLVRVGHESVAPRQTYVFGRAGTRMLDLAFALAAMVILSIPFAALLLYIRRQVVSRFPSVAAARRAAANGWILRFAAPALYLDQSRWIWRKGALVEGPIYKIETLTPDKRPLLGRISLLMRGLGVDEWPQIHAIFSGAWALFGPRAVPNRDGLLAPDGATVQNSRDRVARYSVGGEVRKPGALSVRLALTPRGSIELPPWRTMLIYDRYDCTHWSLRHALQVVGRIALSFLWGEALDDHYGPVETRLVRLDLLPADAGVGESQSTGL